MGNSTKEQWRALFHLALNGSSIAYQVHRGTNLQRSTTYKVLKDMVVKGWLTSDVVGKTNAGLDKNSYSLTLPGLIQVLSRSDSNKIKEILENCKEMLPLVLGKWLYFLDNKVEDLAMYRLRRSCRAFVNHWMPLESSLWEPPSTEESSVLDRRKWKNVEHLFTYYFYDPWITYERSDIFREHPDLGREIRWMKACKADDKIISYISAEISHNISKKKDRIFKSEEFLQQLVK